MILFLYACGMQIGLRHFDSHTLEWLAGALRTGGCTRHALARGLCERLGWRNARGGLCLSAAAKVLPKLAEHLGLELPEARKVPDRSAVPQFPAEEIPDTEVSCALAALGPVTLELTEGEAERRRWEAMMRARHPLGWARSPGGQLRYWIRSERHGVLGGIGFGSATWKLRARDENFGWSPDARAANIGRVICNHRFLVLAGVRVKGLASRVLRMAAERAADDWEARYAVRPAAAYTHVGPEHDGCSYRRAGWVLAGPGSGRRNAAGSVWILGLEDGWRETLGREERHPVGALAGWYDGRADLDWAEREYGRSRHTDGRVRERIVCMGRAWNQNMGEDLPVIFPEKAGQKAAFRLLSSSRVNMKHVLEPHFEATADRCRGESVVLAIQDTTALNYSGLEETTGLSALGGGGKGSAGLLAHAGLAVTKEGRPLGLFSMDADFRQPLEQEGGERKPAGEKTSGKDRAAAAAAGPDAVAEKESRRWIEGLDRARELAAACPHTRVISVCDREGDFWQLLEHAVSFGDALVVRASRSARQRVLKPGGEDACLWEQVAGRAPISVTDLEIPSAGGPRAREKRTARLEIRVAEVSLRPPRTKPDAKPLSLCALSATETGCGEEDDPLHWLLLTTERPAAGEAEAVFAAGILDIYKCRWSIETWFRTLKTGTRIKSRRFDAADDLRKCLAFDAVTACRVADLTQLARERPDTPAATVVPPEDIDLLHTMLRAQGHKIVPTPSGERDGEPSSGAEPPERTPSEAGAQAEAADPAPEGTAVAEPPDAVHERGGTEPDDADGLPEAAAAKDETGTSDADADEESPAPSGAADPPEADDRPPAPDHQAGGPPAAAPEPDIRSFVIDLGRLVGAHPSKRQKLPGTKKVWQGLERLSWAVQVRDALAKKKLE